MLGDVALRHRGYHEADLHRPAGRYGDIRRMPIGIVVGCTLLGWGLVTNANADRMSWQGHLLWPLGLGGREGDWAGANLGVLLAIVLAFTATLLTGREAVRRQESAIR